MTTRPVPPSAPSMSPEQLAEWRGVFDGLLVGKTSTESVTIRVARGWMIFWGVVFLAIAAGLAPLVLEVRENYQRANAVLKTRGALLPGESP